MPSLIALDLPAGPEFVDALREAWDQGNAVLPVDPRLPAPAKRDLIAAMAPAQVVTPAGAVPSEGRPVAAGDALVMATSGTSGRARGVVLTHTAVAAAATAASERLAVDPAADRWLACLPLSHMGGLGVVVRALHTGTPFDVHDGFDPARVEEAAARGATLTSLVPTLLGRLDTGAFRRVLLGGAPPPASTPDNVTVTYGMTETGGGVVYDGIPLDGIEIRTIDAEVQVRGPTLLRTYRDGRDPRSEDGWLVTGDLGSIGEDGRLSIQGRKSDQIISGGENVWPAKVEAALIEHPAVADVAVVGRSDPEWGEIVVALVVPDPGAPPADLADLRSLVAASLPAYMAPRDVEYRKHLPRTALGKLRRVGL
jgi:O-succinylbenzoic acid--CoA ligase